MPLDGRTGLVDRVLFDDVRCEIIVPGGDRAQRTLDDWLERKNAHPFYVYIQRLVQGIEHEFLMGLDRQAVDRVCRHPDPSIRTDHAIGDLRPKDSIREVEDFTTPYTYSYMLHGMMEHFRILPRWSDFWAYFRGKADWAFYTPFKERFSLDPSDRDRWMAYHRALHWRVGNGYYSFLREVDLITRLRCDHGLPIRYHILADVLFRVDMWVGNVLVCVYIKNKTYRDQQFGRKKTVADLIDVSKFKVLHVDLEAPLVFGRPSLVPDAEVERLASVIRSELGWRQ
jgi:hypothetical protein